MFGKKKSEDGGATQPSEAKPKAAKAGKKNVVQKGSSPNFFVAHAEKIVLGVVVLALGYLVYDGIGGKGYDPKRQPDQLGTMADKLLNDIRNNDPWPQLKEERVITHDFAKRTEEARQPSDPALYPLPVMEVQDKGAYEKRGDPELFAPIKVIGQSVVGIIAVEAPENAIDPFEDFEDAEKLEGKQRRDRESNRRGQTGASGAPGYGAGYGMDASGGEPGSGGPSGMPMGGYGMGQGDGQKRLFPSQYNKGFTPGGIGGMGGYGSSMGGMPGYGSGMGGGMPGMGSGAGASASGPLAAGAAAKQKKTLAKPIFFNAVTALVPHEEMLKEYDAKLRESASYMLQRDQPLYLSFEVQRVEITNANQKIEEDDWQNVTDASKQLAMMKNWLPKYPQQVPDVIDPSAADRALTMPIPPILIQDYRRFSKHPDIDWAWDAGMSQMQQQMPMDATATPQETIEGQLPGEQAPVGGAMGGYGMGMGMGMGMGSGSAGYGMDSGSGGMPGYGASGGMPGYGSGESASAGYGMGSGGMPGYGMDSGTSGAMGGYGMGSGGMGSGGMGSGGMGGYGMGMGGYGMGAATRPAPYKMIRFYDQLSGKDVRKTFKYRVRVMMEDPNYPSDRFPAPRSSDMKDDVFARVAKLRQKEDPEAEAVKKENQNARANTPRKVYNRTKRYTPWSDASNGIYVRGTEDVYIGKAEAKRSGGAPEIEAVLVKLDTEKGAYVPMYAFVTKDAKRQDQPPAFHRGTVLVMKELTTQFAHPITTVIKEWPKYPGFDGGSTVVDIRGGDPLVLSEKDDPLAENGEMMLLMGDGRVEITNEFDDAFWYRGFTLADEREAADKAGPSSNDAAAPAGGAASGASSSR